MRADFGQESPSLFWRAGMPDTAGFRRLLIDEPQPRCGGRSCHFYHYECRPEPVQTQSLDSASLRQKSITRQQHAPVQAAVGMQGGCMSLLLLSADCDQQALCR